MFARITGIAVAAVLCAAAPLMASAAWSSVSGAADWSLLPGNNVNGTPVPSTVALTADGLSVAYTGGEYSPGGNNAGVMYNKPVDLSDFSVTFKVDKAAGNYNLQNTGVDTWISICLLNKSDKYFNTNSAGQSQGIVVLIRPMDGKTRFEINMLTVGWSGASRGAYELAGSEQGQTFTFATKLNGDGVYDVYINGTKLQFTGDGGLGGNDFTTSFTTLMKSSNTYLYMGSSSRTPNQTFQYTIKKVNDTTIAGTGTTNQTPQSTVTNNSTATNNGTKTSQTASKANSASAPASSTAAVSGAASSAVSTGPEIASAEQSEPETAVSSEASSQTNAGGGSHAGWIIGIIVVVVVLAAGGTCLYFFVFRKKTA